MNAELPAWLAPLAQQLEPWVPALTITGFIMALASCVAIPWLLLRMPADYFTESYLPHANRGPLAWFFWVIRNVIAVVLLVAGILMLVTFGACGIWTIIDAIMIFTGAMPDADGRALTD